MYDIYLLQYNNYYNRIVKFESELSDYRNASTVTPYILNNVNFNTADGINTELVVNIQDERSIEMFDYALVYDSNDNLTRWFIIDANRLRNGQWRISLRRDVIVDNYSNVINAPTFIEKATLSDLDPLIFNSENMTYNQIKQSESLIKDVTKTAWIVGYLDKSATATNISIPSESQNYDLIIRSDSNLFTKKGVVKRDVYFKIEYKTNNGSSYHARYYPNNNSVMYGSSSWETYPNRDLTYSQTTSDKNILMNLETYIQDNYDYQDRIILDGKTAYDDNLLKYYKLSYKNVHPVPAYTINTLSNIGVILKNILQTTSKGCNNITSIKAQYPRSIELLKNDYVPEDAMTINITTARTICNDSPYDVFAIPLNPDCPMWIGDTQVYPALSSQIDFSVTSMNIANALNRVFGSQLYDLQIVPYCPLNKRIEQVNGGVKFYNVNNNDYMLIDSDGEIKAVLFWCDRTKFELTIEQNVTVPNDSLKVLSETTMCRLVSPNYQGGFEFNPMKSNDYSTMQIINDNLVINNLWDVDCHYKPGTPYIHIAPRFSNLYGQDFNDARGLICGGDFSLSKSDSAWVNYVNNNKNYQNIFDRQIENLEYNNRWSIAENSVGALGGIVQGSAMGAVAGGGIPGAIAGAVVGTAQGALNITETIARQKETLDYTKDQFGYSLGNIKAMPNSLAKVSSFNTNNKIFPFLEVYSCTEREKEALKNKLYYNGMTVGVIGTIAEYQQSTPTYIKGKLIRLTGVDFHEVAVIAEEIDKGVFI